MRASTEEQSPYAESEEEAGGNDANRLERDTIPHSVGEQKGGNVERRPTPPMCT